MRESEAKKIVRGILLGAQRARSINDEGGRRDDQTLNALVEPWLYPPRDCRPMLFDLVNRLDDGETVDPATFMNVLHIAKATPSIAVCALRYGYHIPILGETIQLGDFLGGWEPERETADGQQPVLPAG